jgi:hypothetical protein
MDKKKAKKLRKVNEALSESDRLIGKLSRELEGLRESNNAHKMWTANAKFEAGYDRNTSFDDVWKQVLHRAKTSPASPSEISAKAVEWCIQKLTAELNMYLKSNLVMVVSTEKLAQIHTGVMYHIKDILTSEIRDINGELPTDQTPEQ